MTHTENKVEFEQALSIKVGKFLQGKGYTLASVLGKEMENNGGLDKQDALGILSVNNQAKGESRLLGLLKGEPRKAFLGVIWLENQTRRADEKNWIFETFGNKHLETLKTLSQEISDKFNVNIIFRQISENERAEEFASDSEW